MSAQAVEHYQAQFGALAGTLAGAGVPWLDAQRQGAIARFAETGFPTPKIEDWKYTNLGKLAAIAFGPAAHDAVPVWFGLVFVLLGAAGNGGTIAQLGYLMEISPDDDRPAYSGYFNAFVAPAALLPLAGGVLMKVAGPAAVFGVSAGAAVAQWLIVRRLQPAMPGVST